MRQRASSFAELTRRVDRALVRIEPLLDPLAVRVGLRRLCVFERCVGTERNEPRDVGAASAASLREVRDVAPLLDALGALDTPAAEQASRRARFAAQHGRGERLFVAERDAALVALCWAAAGDVGLPFIECTLRLAPHERYLYDARTAHAARGQRVMPALYLHAAEVLAQTGAERVLTLVRPSNRPMLRAMEHAGFRACGTLYRVAMGERTLYLGGCGVALAR